MAECIVLKGGGGADLDVVTAGKSDVLAGKVIVDKEGEPLSGIMPNRGTVNQTLIAGESYSIPAGYHNGAGKVTANSLASQTPGNADSGSILSGRSAWVNGAKVDGGIPWQNAEIAGTDRAWSQGMSNWAGTINLKVRNGHYLNGVNWIQQDIPEFQPWNIKKGVNIGGVVGTWEGYVAGATDLYYLGDNAAGFTGSGVTFDTGQISVQQSPATLVAVLTLAGHSYLNVQFTSTVEVSFQLWRGSTMVASTQSSKNMISINLSSLQITDTMTLRILFYSGRVTVTRIWYS